MKKIVMLFVAVIAAGIVQAASVDWAINLGKDNFANKTYYIFAASSQSAVDAELAALSDTSAATLDSLALTTGTLNAKAGKASGTALDVGSATGLYMVVLNGTLEDGQTYVTGKADISSISYTPPATSPGVTTFGSSTFTGSGSIVKAGGGGDVPEPTSGLLLLVGGAMLALRRKQK